jgi:Do/DeqQ family serine protease
LNGEPLPSLAPVLEQVTPAVVNIATRAPARRNPLLEDPFFRRFFEVPEASQAPQARSVGSGVIIDADKGLIVTNEHVVEGAAEILVTLHDGREVAAELIGSDPQADIAVIEIKESGLTALPWADTSRLRVGDFCVAIGNPFGLGQTVTSGIVSAMGRSGLGIEDFEDFIQTDASINPGNSGGALINLRGELIGINTAIVGPSGGNVGIGFAIPANMVSDLVSQLVEFGEVQRGELGISAQPLTAELAEAFGLSVDQHGIVIGRVRQESPADKAGLQVGDVITAIDGRPVRDVEAIKNRIGLVRLGQRIQLTVVRDRQPKDIEVVVEVLSDARALFDGLEFADERTRNGRRYVRLMAVEPGSIGDQSGLQAGDAVLSINKQAIESVDTLEKLAAQYNDEILLLLIQRGQNTLYVQLGG